MKALTRLMSLAFAATFVVAATAQAAVDCPSTPPDEINKVCATCHGIDGKGGHEGPNRLATPMLAGQHFEFLVKAMRGYKMGFKWQEDPESVFFTEGMRVHDEMGYAVADLDEESVKAVAAWYHCQK